MKKFQNKVLSMLIVELVTFSSFAIAASIDPLPADNRSGATHVYTVTHEDLTTTDTNTAQTLTWNVPANTGVELIGMVLNQAFDTNNGTNITGSLSVKVGDGNDDDRFLTSTELASDGTEVFVKFPPPNAGTVTLTFQTLALTGTVQNVAVVTNGTASFSASALGRTVYTSADTIDHVFTPTATESVASNDTGSVSFYYRLTPFD